MNHPFQSFPPAAGDSHFVLRDLMGLMALPALWVGKGEETILQLMTDAVSRIVPVVVTYVAVQLPPVQRMTPMFTTAGQPLRQSVPEEWLAFTQACENQADRSVMTESPIGPLVVVRMYMGVGVKGERIWFGFKKDALPSATHMAFLQAAVSLCTTGLNTARIDYDRAMANRTKDEFLAMLGHELRNPLAPLVTTMALIRLKGSGHLTKEHEVIERQVRHLSRLVDDLLDVTRITRGKVDLRMEVFDLRGVVMEAVESVIPLIDEMQHEITVQTDALNAHVNGDPQRIRQVLVNLLVNAAKYTGKKGKINVTSTQDAASVSVSVQDNGTGIEPTLLPRVFDLFEQGLTNSDRSRGGLGIGLAIVKKLVGLHGGMASVESDGPNLGSKFTVTLPRFESSTAHETDPLLSNEPARVAQSSRILVVDDNVDALESLSALLRCYDYEVLAVTSPGDALDQACAFSPDVVILDIGLPDMDGYQLAEELRKSGGKKVQAARFIALTGYGQESDKARSMAAKFYRHLVKPVQVEDLLNAIESAVAS